MASEIRMEVLDRRDIQGLILRGYADLRDARYYLLRIENVDAFKRWLGERLTRGNVSSAATPTTDEEQVLNIAFTKTGLRKLGVDPDAHAGRENWERRDSFPLEFREGMSEPGRSQMLGDVGGSDPKNWKWGGPAGERSADEIDCLCLTFAEEPQPGENARAVLTLWNQIGPGGEAATVVHVLDAHLNRDGTEPFGFRDGISQPILRFTRLDYQTSGPERDLHVIEPGEFMFGYENEHRQMPLSPWVLSARDPRGRLRPLASSGRNGLRDLRDFGRNGTYLVFRQLRQDVGAFQQFLRDTAGEDAEAQHLLAAQMVGRWRNGTPLVLEPARPKRVANCNSFGYFSTDRHGHRCPLGAHIRRGNPRDATRDVDSPRHAVHRSNLHRLIRRGRVYGPSYKDAPQADRGLIFICLNADIRRQFEFVQQVWMNGNKFGGLDDERDPLLAGRGHFTIQTPNVRTRPQLRQFVTVKGGAYFFMPGLAALRCLADPAQEPSCL